MIVGEEERLELDAAQGPEASQEPEGRVRARARSEGEWSRQKPRWEWRRYWLLALLAVTLE